LVRNPRPEGSDLVPVERREPIRVLIADDDHRVRKALSTLLTSSAGFDVVGISATTEGALTLARHHRPMVALIDILLPEATDGLGLLSAITNELHITAIAMSIDGGLRKSALAAGATSFVDKDTRPDELIAALRAVDS
jgi:DNA-binding NarL/FixJ family response regulator